MKIRYYLSIAILLVMLVFSIWIYNTSSKLLATYNMVLFIVCLILIIKERRQKNFNAASLETEFSDKPEERAVKNEAIRGQSKKSLSFVPIPAFIVTSLLSLIAVIWVNAIATRITHLPITLYGEILAFAFSYFIVGGFITSIWGSLKFLTNRNKRFTRGQTIWHLLVALVGVIAILMYLFRP